MSLKLARFSIKGIAATVGVILLIFMIWLRITYIGFVKFADQRRTDQKYTQVFAVGGTFTAPDSTACPTCKMSIDGSLKRNIYAHIEISAPHDIIEYDTESVRLIYRITENEITLDKLPSDITKGTISLSSAGPEIKPENPYIIEKNTMLPFTAIWTISAKIAGNHKLVLAISQSLIEPGVFKPILMLNEGTGLSTDVRNVEIPVVAYTTWGITRFQFELVKLIIAVIVFVLTFPLITDFLKTFRKEGRPSVS